jgi:hypothetical protein
VSQYDTIAILLGLMAVTGFIAGYVAIKQARAGSDRLSDAVAVVLESHS